MLLVILSTHISQNLDFMHNKITSDLLWRDRNCSRTENYMNSKCEIWQIKIQKLEEKFKKKTQWMTEKLADKDLHGNHVEINLIDFNNRSENIY